MQLEGNRLVLFPSLTANRLAEAAAQQQGKWAESDSYKMLRLGSHAAASAMRVFRRFPTSEGATLLSLIDSTAAVEPLLELLEDPVGGGLVNCPGEVPQFRTAGRLTALGTSVILAVECIGDPRAKPGLEQMLGLLAQRDDWLSDYSSVRRALDGWGEKRSEWLRTESLKHLKSAYDCSQSKRSNRIRAITWGPLADCLYKLCRWPQDMYRGVGRLLFRNPKRWDATVATQRQACKHAFVYKPALGVRMDPPPPGKMVCTKCGYSYFA